MGFVDWIILRISSAISTKEGLGVPYGAQFGILFAFGTQRLRRRVGMVKGAIFKTLLYSDLKLSAEEDELCPTATEMP